jgi:hypothetical protein
VVLNGWLVPFSPVAASVPYLLPAEVSFDPRAQTAPSPQCLPILLLRIDEMLPQLLYLNEAIQGRHLLVLGLSFANRLLRFFVQVIKRNVSDPAALELFVAENLRRTRRHRVVVFFDRLAPLIRIVPTDSRGFVAELYKSGVVCVERRDDTKWKLAWMVTPSLLHAQN